jgi:hypothetical protein
MGGLKTWKDFEKMDGPKSWVVVTSSGVIMQKGFKNQRDAEDFRDNAFFGYYKGCEVKKLNN